MVVLYGILVYALGLAVVGAIVLILFRGSGSLPEISLSL